jgi:hypothetical protein
MLGIVCKVRAFSRNRRSMVFFDGIDFDVTCIVMYGLTDWLTD